MRRHLKRHSWAIASLTLSLLSIAAAILWQVSTVRHGRPSASCGFSLPKDSALWIPAIASIAPALGMFCAQRAKVGIQRTTLSICGAVTAILMSFFWVQLVGVANCHSSSGRSASPRWAKPYLNGDARDVPECLVVVDKKVTHKCPNSK